MDFQQHLVQVAHMYHPSWVAKELVDVPRATFQMNTASELLGLGGNRTWSEVEVCDLGGGNSLFAVACASAGAKRSMVIDDFNDPNYLVDGVDPLQAHKSQGVQVVSRDLLVDGLLGIDGQFDLITSFDSLEHWHHSPKALLKQVMAALKPGGAFFLGVPNCLNLRKRITTPLGIGGWSAMADWYEQPVFRGHVREPSVADLRYIARDMGLTDTRVIGRNWVGLKSPTALIRVAAQVFDHALRLRPTLCSDIYLTGFKPR